MQTKDLILRKARFEDWADMYRNVVRYSMIGTIIGNIRTKEFSLFSPNDCCRGGGAFHAVRQYSDSHWGFFRTY